MNDPLTVDFAELEKRVLAHDPPVEQAKRVREYIDAAPSKEERQRRKAAAFMLGYSASPDTVRISSRPE